MTQIVCVLRSGGIYGVEHVARLKKQLDQHAPGVELLACTDLPDVLGVPGVRVRGLMDRWPGWWSKMEIYRLPGPCLYLDLDVSITGDLAPLLDAAAEHDLIAARCFWPKSPHTINSSVMAWRGDVSSLYREFAEAPKAHMSIYESREKWGDQAFVRDHWRAPIALWQDLLPGQVLSYKCDVENGADATAMRICAFHGKPKPWDKTVPGPYR